MIWFRPTFASRFKKGLPLPAVFEPPQQYLDAHSGQRSPIGCVPCLAFNSDQHTIFASPSVLRLLSPVSPLKVAGAIVAVIVGSVHSAVWWLFANILDKRPEVTPLRTDRNASPPVVNIAIHPWVFTPLVHHVPSVVQRVFRYFHSLTLPQEFEE